MTGIEPALSAWEAEVLPLRLQSGADKSNQRNVGSRAASTIDASTILRDTEALALRSRRAVWHNLRASVSAHPASLKSAPQLGKPVVATMPEGLKALAVLGEEHLGGGVGQGIAVQLRTTHRGDIHLLAGQGSGRVAQDGTNKIAAPSWRN